VIRNLQRATFACVFVVSACAARVEPPSPAAADAHGAHAQAPADSHAQQHGHAVPALPATAGPGWTVADVQFMQGMIPHHAQAMVMSRLAPPRTQTREVLMLAEKIDISQEDEIELMRRWLVERNQAVPPDEHLHHMHMPGMLTDAQLAQLEAARGRDFDRLFLQFMIMHHEGALAMAETLFASPGAAQDPDIFSFATDVVNDQTAEIHIMKYLLEVLGANRGSET
jgi:uncharacterized protein (DUF305 family)